MRWRLLGVVEGSGIVSLVARLVKKCFGDTCEKMILYERGK